MVSDTLVTLILTAYMNTACDYSPLYQGRIEPMFISAQWVTHPYWNDDEFHLGDIYYDDRLYRNVKLRYNVYENVLSVVTPGKNLAVVPDAEKIGYFVVDGKKYVRRNGWFECVEHEGNGVSLLHKREKVRANDVEEDYVAYHNLRTYDTYYLAYADGHAVEVEDLKDVMKANQQYAKEIKRHSKELKLKYNKLHLGESLVECAKYLDGKQQGELNDMGKHEHLNEQRNQGLLDAMQMPSSVAAINFSDSTFTTDIPAYYAYIQGSTIRPDYVLMDDDYEDDEPGIGKLDPLRASRTLREVQVVGFKQKLTATTTGVESFRPEKLRNVPLALGEADVMKMATTLPGVNTMGEASSGLNVRGGSADQNLLLYNNNVVYNPMHMFGLFSTFNSDMISETDLFKGGIPAQYGGRLSSVMAIKSKTASKQDWHASASIGALTTKAYVEAPIVRDRVSLLVGGRATYSDWMLKTIPESSGYKNGKAGFWDVGATLSAKIDDRNNLLVTGYYSRDRFSFTEYDKYAYSNLNLSTELRSHWTDKVSSSIAIGYDRYGYMNDDTKAEYSAARLSFNLNDIFLKMNTAVKISDRNSASCGLQVQRLGIMPGKYEPIGDFSFVQARKLDEVNAWESAFYAEDTWEATDRLKFTGGVRLNVFNSLKKDQEKTYVDPEVRFSASYGLGENSSVKFGANTMHQYIHKVSNTVIMSPTDTWTLSSEKIKPQSGYQLSLGYYLQSEDAKYEFSVEGYYKHMNNYLTYRSAAQLVMNSQLEKDVTGTRGRAYGLEVQLRKLYGKINGWVSYTYSKTQLKHDDPAAATKINGGDWFDADYDIPHNIKLVSNFKLSERFSISVNGDYSTGRPFTAPVGQFYDHTSGQVLPYYSKRNGERMPDYFRMDAAFSIEPSHHLTNLTKSWFSIGVYNVLGRKNAYSIYYTTDEGAIKAYKLSVFGAPIPFVSYNIRF